jgi:hydroxymethylbilane synthase
VSPQLPAASLTIGTRGSPLALVQTRLVEESLARAWPSLACSTRVLETRGDRTQATGEPIPEIGGKGLFTAELEAALRSGEIDLAVHSLKDLPTADSPGLVIGAICVRDDVRDCLVSHDGSPLAELAPGAIVGTSSLRRAAQLRALRPDLAVEPVRGNVGTRVGKAREGELDAVVVAAAGIARLGLEGAVAEWLSTETMLPAPGQGALGVQCRDGDAETLAALAPLDDAATRAATTAERRFLADLDAGCSAPVAAHGRAYESGRLELSGLVASVDGSRVVRVSGSGGDPSELGARLARDARDAGASEILDAIRG